VNGHIPVREILLAFDDSPAARAARAWAIREAHAVGRPVRLVYAVSSLGEWDLAAIQVNPDPLRHRFAELLATSWSEPLRAAGIDYSTELVVGRPADAILKVARDRDAEMIVLGMSARGLLHEVLMGTAMRHVLHEARRPVVAVPEGWGSAND
jgi:nucleotide-binding universal stress UspA family protein